MKVLIDIGHPAHVHLFKHFANEMRKRGNKVLFTLRHKEFNAVLLESYSFDYIRYGKNFSSLVGKVLGIVFFNFKLFNIVRKFAPDITISHGSFYLSQVSWLLRIKNITLEDTGNIEQIRLYRPFTNVILTPECYQLNHGKKHIFYNGYHELSYLHPNRFVPDSSVLKSLNVLKREPYVLMRFVSWQASHDKGHIGISTKNKIKAVKEFSKYAKVFISSEKELPAELKNFRLLISPDKIHHVMAYGSLFWGESATMASESAILGVPAIYIDKTGRYYTTEMEYKYGIVYNYSDSISDQEKAIHKGVEVLKNKGGIKEYKEKQKQILEEKIDVTSFLVWFAENYPSSVGVLKTNPKYKERFKL